MSWPQYARGVCTFEGREVALNKGKSGRVQTDVLAALLMRRGQLLTYVDLIEAAYCDDNEPDWAKGTVHAALWRLRQKLPGLILTYGNRMTIDRPGAAPMVNYGDDQLRSAERRPNPAKFVRRERRAGPAPEFGRPAQSYFGDSGFGFGSGRVGQRSKGYR